MSGTISENEYRKGEIEPILRAEGYTEFRCMPAHWISSHKKPISYTWNDQSICLRHFTFMCVAQANYYRQPFAILPGDSRETALAKGQALSNYLDEQEQQRKQEQDKEDLLNAVRQAGQGAYRQGYNDGALIEGDW